MKYRAVSIFQCNEIEEANIIFKTMRFVTYHIGFPKIILSLEFLENFQFNLLTAKNPSFSTIFATLLQIPPIFDSTPWKFYRYRQFYSGKAH